MDIEELRSEISACRQRIDALRTEIAKSVVGQRDVVDGVITCMLAGGHALLEGVPGLGKTMLVRTLAETLSLTFSRIQFTPDLMPADILGTTVIDDDTAGGKTFEFRKGPIFANIVLADEVNRATPKTQSALLEAMQEHRVTVGQATYMLDEPFVVLATQNPLEMEGTYPLPEAQLDRFFFKLHVPSPTARSSTTSSIARPGRRRRARSACSTATPSSRCSSSCGRCPSPATCRTTRSASCRRRTPTGPDAPDLAKRFVRYGSSPRGAQAILLAAKIRALFEGRFAACSRRRSRRRASRRCATAFSSTSRARPRASRPTRSSTRSSRPMSQRSQAEIRLPVSEGS